MKSKLLIFIAFVALVMTSCVSNVKKEAEELNGAHKVVVKEVLQANAYTYLNVTENETDQWIAVPKMEAKEGDIYYFDGFMEMNDFESKDLGRTFESVYFIQEVRTELKPAAHAMDHAGMPEGHMSMDKHEGKPAIAKKEIQIDPVKGGITIAELFGNKEKYAGQKVIIKGKVVKLNFGIMNKNWFHIQDGTNADGDFDLTITSAVEDIELNDVVTFEGTITLNKDFGYGYSYEVIMEDAVVK